jgi:hypothetical protein
LLERNSPTPRPVCPPAQGKIVAVAAHVRACDGTHSDGTHSVAHDGHREIECAKVAGDGRWPESTRKSRPSETDQRRKHMATETNRPFNGIPGLIAVSRGAAK